MRTEPPGPHTAGERAAVILDAIEAHPQFGRLRTGTLAYAERWVTFTGFPLLAEWDVHVDAPGLFVEAVRTMAMRAAVFELTGDERLAELAVAGPVDEMVHALATQFAALSRLQADLVLMFVPSTGVRAGRFGYGWRTEDSDGYDLDGYTDRVYRASGWGEPPRRFWLGHIETRRSHLFTFGRQEDRRRAW
ncbi:conserved hypothetical protein [Frankia sp. AiPs1]|uniref:hypothetical protein n=1 Tax=Frankia sp. AiPa1 TaxID=573492 RepID=UPI00202AD69D|nr:hypothetical protein [Frankia sp. AiPa1]MCL9759766.1 hypothetical protein [Frankia sp. AiPa1]